MSSYAPPPRVAAPPKHLLFFSKYCTYCNEIMSAVDFVRDSFTLICVDSRRNQIPYFVDRVPAIYTTDRQLYVDEQVIEFIRAVAQHNAQYQSQANPQQQQQQQQQQGSNDAIDGVSPFSLKGQTSDGFSMINDGSVVDESTMNYTFSSFNNPLAMNSRPAASNDNNGKPMKTSPDMLERYTHERDLDNQRFWPQPNKVAAMQSMPKPEFTR